MLSKRCATDNDFQSDDKSLNGITDYGERPCDIYHPIDEFQKLEITSKECRRVRKNNILTTSLGDRYTVYNYTRQNACRYDVIEYRSF